MLDTVTNQFDSQAGVGLCTGVRDVIDIELIILPKIKQIFFERWSRYWYSGDICWIFCSSITQFTPGWHRIIDYHQEDSAAACAWRLVYSLEAQHGHDCTLLHITTPQRSTLSVTILSVGIAWLPWHSMSGDIKRRRNVLAIDYHCENVILDYQELSSAELQAPTRCYFACFTLWLYLSPSISTS